ncbi:MAG: hypothetical protein HOP09_06515 [Hyphomicrobium sp.]|nr:hypothetical protein [Hyphomicrobium sp.]
MSRKRKATKAPEIPRHPPGRDEALAIEHAKQCVTARSPRVTVDCKQTSAGQIDVFGAGHNDHNGWLARIENAFGTRGSAFALSQLNRLIAVCRDDSRKIDVARLNGLLALVEGAGPQNEVQAALAVQMALTHHVAQTVLLRAARVDQIPQFDSASNSAVKLLRTFALQAEVLAKLQRGGEQIVKVVHVHPGAQAIVGNVVSSAASGASGGGVADDKWNQPHAPERLLPSTGRSEAEPVSTLLCQDAERQPVPVAIGQR